MIWRRPFIYGLLVWLSTGVSGGIVGSFWLDYDKLMLLIIGFGLVLSMPAMLGFIAVTHQLAKKMTAKDVVLHRICCVLLAIFATLATMTGFLGRKVLESLFDTSDTTGTGIVWTYLILSGFWAFVWHFQYSKYVDSTEISPTKEIQDNILDQFD